MPSTKSNRGFTLIELMIVVVVIGILAAIAYPSFIEQVRKGRRSDGITAISAIMQAQERWRANCPSYTSNVTATNTDPFCEAGDGLGLASSSPGLYYTLAVSGVSATGYTATATAVGAQATDAKCTAISVTVAGATTTYNATPSGNGNICWNR